MVEIHDCNAARLNVERDSIAYEEWLNMIREDAEREFQMGDVDESQLSDFLDKVK